MTVIIAGILAVAVCIGSMLLSGKCEDPNTVSSSKEKATLNPEERRKREEECIRWLKDHKVTGDSFLAFDPLRDTDEFIWNEKYLEHFRGADLSDSAIREDDLHYVLMIPNLKFLFLNTDTTKLPANGLKPFENHRKLEIISIEGDAAIPNGWIKSLAMIPKITAIVCDAPVTDETFKVLAEHRPKIEHLLLGNNANAITDAGLEAIGNLQHLKVLSISAGQKKNIGGPGIGDKTPEQGDIHHSSTPDNTIAITENGLRAIGGLQQLENLIFSSMNTVTDKQIRQILRCKNLTTLSLFALDTDMELTVQTAKDLAAMPKLEELMLSSNTTPSKSFLAALGRKSWKNIDVGYPALRIKAEKEDRICPDLTREAIQQAVADEARNSKKVKTDGDKSRKSSPPKW